MPPTTDSNRTNQSTVAAFAVLEEMAQHTEPARVTDIANALGMPRARTHRYLQTLVQLGYVRQDAASERYRLTLKLFHLGQAIADGTQLTAVARPVMAALRDSVQQTVTLSIPEEAGMRVIDIVRVETPVQIITRPGALLPLHSSAQGKVALAWGNTSLLDRFNARLDAGDPELAGLDRDTLQDQIAEARAKGWAIAPQEILPGVNAISTPVFDSDGQFVATITVVGSVQQITSEPDPTYIRAALDAAREISTNLGYLEYPV